MNTVPNKAGDDKGSKQNISRLEKMRSDLGDKTFVPKMPFVNADYMLKYFYQVGPANFSGKKYLPISFCDIQAWENVTGFEINSWESITLRRMSVAFCTESESAKSIDAETPWTDAPYIKPIKEILLSRLKAAF